MEHTWRRKSSLLSLLLFHVFGSQSNVLGSLYAQKYLKRFEIYDYNSSGVAQDLQKKKNKQIHIFRLIKIHFSEQENKPFCS